MSNKLHLYDINDSKFQKMQTEWSNGDFRGRKSQTDYVKTARAMLWFEEMEQSKALKKFNQKNVRLIRKKDEDGSIVFCFRNNVSFDFIHFNVIQFNVI